MVKILVGSLEWNKHMITAGVLEYSSEFEFENLRYVHGKISDMKPGETILSFLDRIYQNSTGCLIKQDFKLL